ALSCKRNTQDLLLSLFTIAPAQNIPTNVFSLKKFHKKWIDLVFGDISKEALLKACQCLQARNFASIRSTLEKTGAKESLLSFMQGYTDIFNHEPSRHTY